MKQRVVTDEVEASSRSEQPSPAQSIEEIVEEVGHYLPEQAPLHAFVHHNTLHCFEHLHFEEAVVEASRRFGTEPFQTEEAFASCLESGRIRSSDITAVLGKLHESGSEPVLPGGPTRRELRVLRLLNLFEIPSGPALHWLLTETDVRQRFCPALTSQRRGELRALGRQSHGEIREAKLERALLEGLWRHLEAAAPSIESSHPLARARDRILDAVGIDTDEAIHPLMIRVSAAYLDQGIAYWPMPNQELGFLKAFRNLYRRRLAPIDQALRGLSTLLRAHDAENWNAAQTIRWALSELAIPEANWRACIDATLMSLKGWAGMMRQFELHPDRAPVRARPASLMDYLAVQLTLDVVAARNALHGVQDKAAVLGRRRPLHGTDERPNLELVYEAFLLAQLAPIDTNLLANRSLAKSWLEEIASFDTIDRRRILHLAYERHHRNGVLDGLAAHCALPALRVPVAKFQAVFCIDDREESFRRHLEECQPDSETFGYAGFYGVAMAYRGLDDVHARPLCPVSMKPKHLIEERALQPSEEGAYFANRRRRGALEHSVSIGSKTLTRGSLLTGFMGLASVVPLIGRCLFPRLSENWHLELQHSSRPSTRLVIEAEEARREGEDMQRGYTPAEMVEVVHDVLSTLPLTADFSPLVILVGHGSSSLNNPHEAAHDCGATGGGRGGPNARAFAAMANHPRVRALLAERGLQIPDSTHFLGAYHNTCDDSMTYFDEDLVPESHETVLTEAKLSLQEACVLNAHERCRRFESAPRDIPLKRALAHVEVHAQDLGQPRPEYGHATNAVCIVGRRARTRGLFLDRRAFLVSYDPTADEEGEILRRLLLSVGPVGAGINLEYYFSFVDPTHFGCGTKLPHNITGLIGIMNGHASDLRTGLPWQMVEIHEPVRLLTIVEAETEVLERILEREPGLAGLINGEWIQFVAWSPSSGALSIFSGGAFQPYCPESTSIPVFEHSVEHYAGRRGHLGCAHITSSAGVKS